MQPGTRLGDRYALIELLGTGAHTGVWSGHDAVRDRPVRIKALDPQLSADAAVRLRFHRTALEVSALDVPDIADVLECLDHHDDDGDLTVCQITAPIDGVPLSRMLSRGLDLGTEEVLSLIAVAAWAVDEAREAGVRHLNLKPANLFVAERSVTVADFGYLPVPEPGPYTAAEQHEGAAPGRTADVYALGAIAYECLTGAAPTGSDPIATLPVGTRPGVVALLERALARDPGLRFGSAGALAAECEQVNHTNDVLGALLARQQDRAEPPTAAAPAVVEPEPAATESLPAWPLIPGEVPEPEAVLTPAAEPVPAPRAAVRRPATPPAHAVKPRRSRKAVLAAVAVAAVAGGVVGLFALTPEAPAGSSAADEEKPGYVLPSSLEPTSTSPSQSPSQSPDEEPVTGSSPAGSSSEEDSESPKPLMSDEPEPQQPPAKVKVPDVVGDSRAAALGELRDAGLKSKVTKTGEGEFECTVHEQNPRAGASVPEDTTVTVRLRLAATEAECDGDGGNGDDGGQTSPSSSSPVEASMTSRWDET